DPRSRRSKKNQTGEGGPPRPCWPAYSVSVLRRALTDLGRYTGSSSRPSITHRRETPEGEEPTNQLRARSAKTSLPLFASSAHKCSTSARYWRAPHHPLSQFRALPGRTSAGPVPPRLL